MLATTLSQNLKEFHRSLRIIFFHIANPNAVAKNLNRLLADTIKLNEIQTKVNNVSRYAGVSP